jgi:hypothetical protein
MTTKINKAVPRQDTAHPGTPPSVSVQKHLVPGQPPSLAQVPSTPQASPKIGPPGAPPNIAPPVASTPASPAPKLGPPGGPPNTTSRK